jgi:hypothetical protein
MHLFLMEFRGCLALSESRRRKSFDMGFCAIIFRSTTPGGVVTFWVGQTFLSAIVIPAKAGTHFAVFPEQLCTRPIFSSCPPGGIVLDPFAASGTVGVVAKRLGRNCILIDVNRDYCKMARKRIKSA